GPSQALESGERGVVEAGDGEKLVVRLEKTALVVHLQADQVTNFSLAARKAWVTGPDRGVGRRKGTKLRDRVTVTFRIDRDLWERFEGLEEAGAIADRNAVVNSRFGEQLPDWIDRRRET